MHFKITYVLASMKRYRTRLNNYVSFWTKKCLKTCFKFHMASVIIYCQSEFVNIVTVRYNNKFVDSFLRERHILLLYLNIYSQQF